METGAPDNRWVFAGNSGVQETRQAYLQFALLSGSTVSCSSNSDPKCHQPASQNAPSDVCRLGQGREQEVIKALWGLARIPKKSSPPLLPGSTRPHLGTPHGRPPCSAPYLPPLGSQLGSPISCLLSVHGGSQSCS